MYSAHAINFVASKIKLSTTFLFLHREKEQTNTEKKADKHTVKRDKQIHRKRDRPIHRGKRQKNMQRKVSDK